MDDRQILLWLADQEGFSAIPYLDPDGRQWNIGFGSYLSRDRPKGRHRITVDEAWKRLEGDWSKSKEIAKQLTGDRFSHDPRVVNLVGMLVFNGGPNIVAGPKMRAAIESGDGDRVRDIARTMIHVNDEPNDILRRRRNAEVKWSTGDEDGFPIRSTTFEKYGHLVPSPETPDAPPVASRPTSPSWKPWWSKRTPAEAEEIKSGTNKKMGFFESVVDDMRHSPMSRGVRAARDFVRDVRFPDRKKSKVGQKSESLVDERFLRPASPPRQAPPPPAVEEDEEMMVDVKDLLPSDTPYLEHFPVRPVPKGAEGLVKDLSAELKTPRDRDRTMEEIKDIYRNRIKKYKR